jgi:hypothetical protein
MLSLVRPFELGKGLVRDRIAVHEPVPQLGPGAELKLLGDRLDTDVVQPCRRQHVVERRGFLELEGKGGGSIRGPVKPGTTAWMAAMKKAKNSTLSGAPNTVISTRPPGPCDARRLAHPAPHARKERLRRTATRRHRSCRRRVRGRGRPLRGFRARAPMRVRGASSSCQIRHARRLHDGQVTAE